MRCETVGQGSSRLGGGKRRTEEEEDRDNLPQKQLVRTSRRGSPEVRDESGQHVLARALPWRDACVLLARPDRMPATHVFLFACMGRQTSVAADE
jgi:hypothetical protein